MLLYGLTGLWLQHRAVLPLPGPHTEKSSEEIVLSAPLSSPDELKSLLQQRYAAGFEEGASSSPRPRPCPPPTARSPCRPAGRCAASPSARAWLPAMWRAHCWCAPNCNRPTSPPASTGCTVAWAPACRGSWWGSGGAGHAAAGPHQPADVEQAARPVRAASPCCCWAPWSPCWWPCSRAFTDGKTGSVSRWR